MSETNIELVSRLSVLFSEQLVDALRDEERSRQIVELVSPAFHPDAEISFHGAEAVGMPGEYRGAEGLLAGWREWTSSFASYHVEIEGAFEASGRVVVLARQAGRTIHGDVDVPSSPSAAVVTVVDGVVTRMAFYLDRAQAARDEGFELPGG